jgi:hypothetical protein
MPSATPNATPNTTPHRHRNAFIATAAAALSLAGAGPAAAARGGDGPGGPDRFVLDASSGTCDVNTGKDAITVTISPSSTNPNWQYVGVYSAEKAPGSWNDGANVSQAVAEGGAWIGPGSAPVRITFEVPTLPQGYYMEVDAVDQYPNDGWYNDITGLPMDSICIPFGIYRTMGTVHTF